MLGLSRITSIFFNQLPYNHLLADHLLMIILSASLLARSPLTISLSVRLHCAKALPLFYDSIAMYFHN